MSYTTHFSFSERKVHLPSIHIVKVGSRCSMRTFKKNSSGVPWEALDQGPRKSTSSTIWRFTRKATKVFLRRFSFLNVPLATLLNDRSEIRGLARAQRGFHDSPRVFFYLSCRRHRSSPDPEIGDHSFESNIIPPMRRRGSTRKLRADRPPLGSGWTRPDTAWAGCSRCLSTLFRETQEQIGTPFIRSRDSFL